MLKLVTLALAGLASFNCVSAVPAPKVGRVGRPNSVYKHKTPFKRDLYTDQVNLTNNINEVTAPHENIWLYLSDDEAAGVVSFLHNQTELNLTAAADAGSWDNSILVVDLAPHNKSDALAFLNGSAPAPDRYARVSISFAATDEPYYQEFFVGPLPVSDKTFYTSYDWTSTKEVAKIRNYDADGDLTYAAYVDLSMEISDIILDLMNGTVTGSDDDTFDIWGIDPLWHEDGRVMVWNTYWRYPDNIFDGETVMPQGLYFKYDITGRDPSGWGLVGWLYNDIYYDSTAALRAAWESPDFVKKEILYSGDWFGTDQKGTKRPYSDLPPPEQVQVAQRFEVDPEQHYFKWMDFEGYLTFRRDTGLRFYNIKFKNETFLYELGLDEAVAHYAGNDPVQAGTAYLDTYYGVGPYSLNLVPGFDCPQYATYLNATFHAAEISTTHGSAICMFEQDAGYPMGRHSTSAYVAGIKNTQFVIKIAATVGNYDYTFAYTFYLDGSLETSVAASGYIQAAYYAQNEGYGYKIHKGLSGSMHDHNLHYKADFDILGTSNTLAKHSVVAKDIKYPWSNTTRSTMKLERSYIESEDEGKINWSPNAQSMYVVVNKDELNEFGEERGYRVMPLRGPGMHLTIQDSPNLLNSQGFATHNFYVTKQKDTEPYASNAWNDLDTGNPLVDFSTFFDGDSLVQEDIVLWINIGMHHVPNTQDLPVTVMNTAQASMVFVPQNYHTTNPVTESPQMIRIDYSSDGVSDVHTFGALNATGSIDLSANSWDPYTYSGDVNIRKFPYDPANPYNDTETIV